MSRPTSRSGPHPGAGRGALRQLLSVKVGPAPKGGRRVRDWVEIFPPARAPRARSGVVARTRAPTRAPQAAPFARLPHRHRPPPARTRTHARRPRVHRWVCFRRGALARPRAPGRSRPRGGAWGLGRRPAPAPAPPRAPRRGNSTPRPAPPPTRCPGPRASEARRPALARWTAAAAEARAPALGAPAEEGRGAAATRGPARRPHRAGPPAAPPAAPPTYSQPGL